MQIVLIPIIAFLSLLDVRAQQEYKMKRSKAFIPGEQLKYTIRYGLITGGEALIELRETNYDNKSVYHSRMTGQTTGIVDKIFAVRDIYESYFDRHTMRPLKAIRNIREGGYRYYNEVFYNHDSLTAYSQRSDSTFRVPVNTLDMVSTLYYIRSVNMDKLEPGDALDIITFFGDEIFPFKVRFTGIEEVKSKLGRINCYRFDPVVEPGRIFKTEDDMTFWITADRNMIPITIRFNMIVGSVKVELVEHSNLKYQIDFR